MRDMLREWANLVIESGPDAIPPLEEAGLDLWTGGDLKGGASCLRKAAELCRRFEEGVPNAERCVIWSLLAELLVELGEPQEAETWLSCAAPLVERSLLPTRVLATYWQARASADAALGRSAEPAQRLLDAALDRMMSGGRPGTSALHDVCEVAKPETHTANSWAALLARAEKEPPLPLPELDVIDLVAAVARAAGGDPERTPELDEIVAEFRNARPDAKPGRVYAQAAKGEAKPFLKPTRVPASRRTDWNPTHGAMRRSPGESGERTVRSYTLADTPLSLVMRVAQSLRVPGSATSDAKERFRTLAEALVADPALRREMEAWVATL